MYSIFPTRFDILLYNADIHESLSVQIHFGGHSRSIPPKITLINISRCMPVVPPLGELPKTNFPFQPLLSPPQGEELKSRAARVAKKSFPCSSASYETDRRVEGREKRKQWKGGVEPRQREERRGHTYPIRAQQTPVHPEPGGTGGFTLSQQDKVRWTRSFRPPRSGCQRGTTSTHDHRAAGKGKTSLLWFSFFLSSSLSAHTLTHSPWRTHSHTPSLSCMWVRLFLSVPSRNLCAILTQLQRCSSCWFQGGRTTNLCFSAWRVIHRLTCQA